MFYVPDDWKECNSIGRSCHQVKWIIHPSEKHINIIIIKLILLISFNYEFNVIKYFNLMCL